MSNYSGLQTAPRPPFYSYPSDTAVLSYVGNRTVPLFACEFNTEVILPRDGNGNLVLPMGPDAGIHTTFNLVKVTAKPIIDLYSETPPENAEVILEVHFHLDTTTADPVHIEVIKAPRHWTARLFLGILNYSISEGGGRVIVDLEKPFGTCINKHNKYYSHSVAEVNTFLQSHSAYQEISSYL